MGRSQSVTIEWGGVGGTKGWGRKTNVYTQGADLAPEGGPLAKFPLVDMGRRGTAPMG